MALIRSARRVCLLIGIIATAFAAEKSPAPTPAPSFLPFTLSVTRGDNARLPSRLLLYDAAGKLLPAPDGLPFRLCDKQCTLRLPAGRYTAVADAGMRLHKSRHWFLVGEKHPDKLALTLSPCAWNTAWGWSLLNPFFANTPAQLLSATVSASPCRWPTLAAVRHIAQSGGLDACGVSDLERLLLKQPGTAATYAEREDGWRMLTRALAAPEPCRLFPCWDAEIAGGKILFLEPQPFPGVGMLPEDGSSLPLLAAARDRGALTVLARATGGHNRPASAEALFCLLAGGLYDALDISRGGNDYAFWQTLLRMGLRIPAVAGGGETPNLSMYVHVSPRTGTTPEYLQSLREGTSIVSNGPFLRMTVWEQSEENGESVPATFGGMLNPSARQRQVRVTAIACSDPADCISKVELLYNGKVIESAQGHHGQKTMEAVWNDLALRDNGCLQVRYISQAAHLWAISNPVYIGEAPKSFSGTATAEVRVKLRTRDNAPKTVEVIGENFGVQLFARRIRLPQTFSCRLPATATLNINIPGRKPLRKTLYEISGAKAYGEKLTAVADPRALFLPENLRKFRNLVRTIETEITVDN